MWRVALRAVGVVLPGIGALGVAELRGGVPDGDFGTFLGAMGLSMLAAAVWSAVDARRSPTSRVLVRWIVAAVVVGVSLGVVITVTAPGVPPGPERIGQAAWLAVFFGVPLLVAAVLGTAAVNPRVVTNDTDQAGKPAVGDQSAS